MRKYELSTKQKAAIRALLAGMNHQAAAKLANVHPNQISAWLRKPVFSTALHKAEDDALDSISRGLLAAASKSSDTLSELQDTGAPGIRIRAADVLLGKLTQLYELRQLAERIEKLESQYGKKT